MAPATTALAPLLRPEIIEFARRNGVAAYLDSVLSMTRHVFPNALSLDVTIEEDGEIPGDAHLLVLVQLPRLGAEQYVTSKFKWGKELFRIRPAPVVCVFRCRLNTDER